MILGCKSFEPALLAKSNVQHVQNKFFANQAFALHELLSKTERYTFGLDVLPMILDEKSRHIAP